MVITFNTTISNSVNSLSGMTVRFDNGAGASTPEITILGNDTTSITIPEPDTETLRYSILHAQTASIKTADGMYVRVIQAQQTPEQKSFVAPVVLCGNSGGSGIGPWLTFSGAPAFVPQAGDTLYFARNIIQGTTATTNERKLSNARVSVRVHASNVEWGYPATPAAMAEHTIVNTNEGYGWIVGDVTVPATPLISVVPTNNTAQITVRPPDAAAVGWRSVNKITIKVYEMPNRTTTDISLGRLVDTLIGNTAPFTTAWTTARDNSYIFTAQATNSIGDSAVALSPLTFLYFGSIGNSYENDWYGVFVSEAALVGRKKIDTANSYLGFSSYNPAVFILAAQDITPSAALDSCKPDNVVPAMSAGDFILATNAHKVINDEPNAGDYIHFKEDGITTGSKKLALRGEISVVGNSTVVGTMRASGTTLDTTYAVDISRMGVVGYSATPSADIDNTTTEIKNGKTYYHNPFRTYSFLLVNEDLNLKLDKPNSVEHDYTTIPAGYASFLKGTIGDWNVESTKSGDVVSQITAGNVGLISSNYSVDPDLAGNYLRIYAGDESELKTKAFRVYDNGDVHCGKLYVSGGIIGSGSTALHIDQKGINFNDTSGGGRLVSSSAFDAIDFKLYGGTAYLPNASQSELVSGFYFGVKTNTNSNTFNNNVFFMGTLKRDNRTASDVYSVDNAFSHFIAWDNNLSNLTVCGKLYASGGTIGGWNLSETSLYAGTGDNQIHINANPDTTVPAILIGTSSYGTHTALRLTRYGDLRVQKDFDSPVLNVWYELSGGLSRYKYTSSTTRLYQSRATTSDNWGASVPQSVPVEVFVSCVDMSPIGLCGFSAHNALVDATTNTEAMRAYSFKFFSDSNKFELYNGKIADWNFSQDTLSSGSGSSYVALSTTGTYAIWAGAETASSNTPFSVTHTGVLTAQSGTVGGWTLDSTSLSKEAGALYARLESTTPGIRLRNKPDSVYHFVDVNPGGISVYTSSEAVPDGTANIKARDNSFNVFNATYAANTLATSSPVYAPGDVVIGSVATDNQSFWFQASTGDLIIGKKSSNSYISYVDSTGVLTVKGRVEADAGKIGGWSLSTTSLYAGSGNSYISINSNTDTTVPAILIGTPTYTKNTALRLTRYGDLRVQTLLDAPSIGVWYELSGGLSRYKYTNSTTRLYQTRESTSTESWSTGITQTVPIEEFVGCVDMSPEGICGFSAHASLIDAVQGGAQSMRAYSFKFFSNTTKFELYNGKIANWTFTQDTLSSGTDSSYVALSTTGTHAIWAGSETSTSAPFSVTSSGVLKAESGTVGGWTLNSTGLSKTDGTKYIRLETATPGIRLQNFSNSYYRFLDINPIGISGYKHSLATPDGSNLGGRTYSFNIYNVDDGQYEAGDIVIGTQATTANTVRTVESLFFDNSAEKLYVNGNLVSGELGGITVNDKGLLFDNATARIRCALNDTVWQNYGPELSPSYLPTTDNNTTITGFYLGKTTLPITPPTDTEVFFVGYLKRVDDETTDNVCDLHDDSKFLAWNGSQVVVKGAIYADEGAIGSGANAWQIKNEIIESGANSTYTALCSNTAKKAFWAGDTLHTDAPLTISHLGEIRLKKKMTPSDYHFVDLNSGGISVFSNNTSDPDTDITLRSYSFNLFNTEYAENELATASPAYAPGDFVIGSVATGAQSLYFNNTTKKLYVTGIWLSGQIGYSGLTVDDKGLSFKNGTSRISSGVSDDPWVLVPGTGTAPVYEPYTEAITMSGGTVFQSGIYIGKATRNLYTTGTDVVDTLFIGSLKYKDDPTVEGVLKVFDTSSRYLCWDGNSLTVRGIIYATEGTIGGGANAWQIKDKKIESGAGNTYTALSSGSTYAIWAGSETDSSAPFRVTATGTLTASSADITGKITASSGTVASWIIETGKLSTGSGLTYVQLSTGDYAIWAGADSAASTAPFSVTNTGVLTAKSGTVGGWSIGTDSIYQGNTYLCSSGIYSIRVGAISGSVYPFSVTPAGALTANSGTVGGWTLGNTSLTNSTVGISSATGTNAISIWAGNAVPASAPFWVKPSGEIKASSGTVGGWTLGTTSLSATNSDVYGRNEKFVDIRTSTPGLRFRQQHMVQAGSPPADTGTTLHYNYIDISPSGISIFKHSGNDPDVYFVGNTAMYDKVQARVNYFNLFSSSCAVNTVSTSNPAYEPGDLVIGSLNSGSQNLYFNATTSVLTITGTIYALQGTIGGWNITQFGLECLETHIGDTADHITTGMYNGKLGDYGYDADNDAVTNHGDVRIYAGNSTTYNTGTGTYNTVKKNTSKFLVTSTGYMKASAGNIGGLEITSTGLVFSTSSQVSAGTVNWHSHTFQGGAIGVVPTSDSNGIFLGNNTVGVAANRFYVGKGGIPTANGSDTPTENFLAWTGTTLYIQGTIWALSGKVGGFTLSSTFISKDDLTLYGGVPSSSEDSYIMVGSSPYCAGIHSVGSSTTTPAIWAGSSEDNRTSAPFRLYPSGEMICNYHRYTHEYTYGGVTTTIRIDLGMKFKSIETSIPSKGTTFKKSRMIVGQVDETVSDWMEGSTIFDSTIELRNGTEKARSSVTCCSEPFTFRGRTVYPSLGYSYSGLNISYWLESIYNDPGIHFTYADTPRYPFSVIPNTAHPYRTGFVELHLDGVLSLANTSSGGVLSSVVVGVDESSSAIEYGITLPSSVPTAQQILKVDRIETEGGVQRAVLSWAEDLTGSPGSGSNWTVVSTDYLKPTSSDIHGVKITRLIGSDPGVTHELSYTVLSNTGESQIKATSNLSIFTENESGTINMAANATSGDPKTRFLISRDYCGFQQKQDSTWLGDGVRVYAATAASPNVKYVHLKLDTSATSSYTLTLPATNSNGYLLNSGGTLSWDAGSSGGGLWGINTNVGSGLDKSVRVTDTSVTTLCVYPSSTPNPMAIQSKDETSDVSGRWRYTNFTHLINDTQKANNSGDPVISLCTGYTPYFEQSLTSTATDFTFTKFVTRATKLLDIESFLSTAPSMFLTTYNKPDTLHNSTVPGFLQFRGFTKQAAGVEERNVLLGYNLFNDSGTVYNLIDIIASKLHYHPPSGVVTGDTNVGEAVGVVLRPIYATASGASALEKSVKSQNSYLTLQKYYGWSSNSDTGTATLTHSGSGGFVLRSGIQSLVITNSGFRFRNTSGNDTPSRPSQINDSKFNAQLISGTSSADTYTNTGFIPRTYFSVDYSNNSAVAMSLGNLDITSDQLNWYFPKLTINIPNTGSSQSAITTNPYIMVSQSTPQPNTVDITNPITTSGDNTTSTYTATLNGTKLLGLDFIFSGKTTTNSEPNITLGYNLITIHERTTSESYPSYQEPSIFVGRTRIGGFDVVDPGSGHAKHVTKIWAHYLEPNESIATLSKQAPSSLVKDSEIVLACSKQYTDQSVTAHVLTSARLSTGKSYKWYSRSTLIVGEAGEYGGVLLLRGVVENPNATGNDLFFSDSNTTNEFGMICFNASTGKLLFHNGSGWQIVAFSPLHTT